MIEHQLHEDPCFAGFSGPVQTQRVPDCMNEREHLTLPLPHAGKNRILTESFMENLQLNEQLTDGWINKRMDRWIYGWMDG